MWGETQLQQQILKARRSGKAWDADNSEVFKKRLKVSKFMNNTLDKASDRRCLLACPHAQPRTPPETLGVVFHQEETAAIKERNRKKAAALSKEAVTGGIPLPMASFGMPEFDGGERFDLKGPYVDEGWVDESAKGDGLFGGLKKLFGKKDKKKGDTK